MGVDKYGTESKELWDQSKSYKEAVESAEEYIKKHEDKINQYFKDVWIKIYPVYYNSSLYNHYF